MRLPCTARPAKCQSDPGAVEGYVLQTQKDGRLLLRYLARRSDRALPEKGPAGLTVDGKPSHVLFDSPGKVARSPEEMAELVGCVDYLGRQVAPTNVRSIRLTCSYLGMTSEDGEPPEGIKREARGVQMIMRFIAILVALPVLLLAVLLLAHVDFGRRMLVQFDDLRKQEAGVRDDIIKSPYTDWKPPAETAGTGNRAAGSLAKPKPGVHPSPSEAQSTSGGLGRCGATNPNEGFWAPNTPATAELCRKYADLEKRLGLASIALADWNCRTTSVLSPLETVRSWISTVESGISQPSDNGEACQKPITDLGSLDPAAWRSFEIRVSSTIGVIGGFVLPLLLGCAGGCTYVLRRHIDKLRNWTLEPYDGRSALIRVVLAAILGGLVGVLWSPDQPVSLSGYSLSLAALAFFVGLSVEAVFKLIERITTSVEEAVQSQPTTAAVAAAPMRSGPNDSMNPETNRSRVEPGQQALQISEDTKLNGDLAKAVQDLKDHRQSLAAIAQADAGVPVVANATAMIGDIDRALRTVQPLLVGKADADAVAQALTQTQDVLKTAENVGLPGILADSASTLAGVLDFAKPVLAGIPGGPFGIVAGIVLGGLQLADNRQQFQALKSALLRQPFDPVAKPTIPSGLTALAALDAAPLMKGHVQAAAGNADFAMGLMHAVLQRRADGTLVSTDDLVSDLMGPDTRQLGLAKYFESPRELAQAIEEYRGATVFTDTLKRLDASVAIPAIGGAPAASVALNDVAKAALEAANNPRAASAIEQLVSVTESLAKTTIGPQAAVDLVRNALAKVPDLVRTARVLGAAA